MPGAARWVRPPGRGEHGAGQNWGHHIAKSWSGGDHIRCQNQSKDGSRQQDLKGWEGHKPLAVSQLQQHERKLADLSQGKPGGHGYAMGLAKEPHDRTLVLVVLPGSVFCWFALFYRTPEDFNCSPARFCKAAQNCSGTVRGAAVMRLSDGHVPVDPKNV